MCSKPEFITEKLETKDVFIHWISQLDRIEKRTVYQDEKDKEEAIESSFDLAYLLFPIIDSVALNLFNQSSGRKYLEALGYTKKEAFMIYAIFRNGILHSTKPYIFKYEDGEISWGLSSSSGSTGFRPYYEGYKDTENPEYDVPADKAFEYVEYEQGKYHASLTLSTLVSQVKYDLLERQKQKENPTIDYVVGQKITGSVPSIDSVT